MEIDVDRWQDQVNASSRVPFHAQLRSIIESHLDSDGYRAGDRLPNEDKLVTRFQVSRPTIRQTLNGMVADGLIVRQRGMGTMLVQTRPPVPAMLQLDLAGGFAKAAAAGAVEVVVDTDDGRTPIAAMTRVERIVRNGVRIGVCRIWPSDLVAPVVDDELGQDDLLRVVAGLLGEEPVISKLTVHTDKASTPDLTDLEIGPGSAVLVVETAWSDHHGLVVMRSHARWRGDQVCVDLLTGGERPRPPADPADPAPRPRSRSQHADPQSSRPDPRHLGTTPMHDEIAENTSGDLASGGPVLHDRPGVQLTTVQRVRAPRVSAKAASRPRPARIRMTVCVSLGDDWRAAVLRDQLIRQLDTAVADRRFRLEPIDPTRDMMTQVKSHRARGLILRASQTPEIFDDVAALTRSEVPVVTIGSDLPSTSRVGFAGGDGLRAGEAVARQMLTSPTRAATVLMLTPDLYFRADEEIAQGFRRTARTAGIRVVTVSSRSHPGSPDRRSRVKAAVAETAIDAMFSIGPGASDALEALREQGQELHWAVAWDLTPEHLELLASGNLNTVADMSAKLEAIRALRLAAGGFDGRAELPTMPMVEFHVRTETASTIADVDTDSEPSVRG